MTFAKTYDDLCQFHINAHTISIFVYVYLCLVGGFKHFQPYLSDSCEMGNGL